MALAWHWQFVLEQQVDPVCSLSSICRTSLIMPPSDTLLPPDVPLLQKAEFQLHPACPQLLSSDSFSHLTLVPSKPGFAISTLSLCSDFLYCHCY